MSSGASLADVAAVLLALRVAVDKMDEDEVPDTDRHLFITPTLYGMIRDLDTTKSKEVLAAFSSVTKVPQSRFYTAIELKSGKTGQEAGGYAKASGAADINFLIVHNGDGYKFGYRNVGIADAYKNKLAGIYLHHKATA